jgi:SAM-dependent methyltransferase
VAIGFFPAALDADARYDIVAFNDVFEHLPKPRVALRDVRRVLRPGGLLAINLPSSRGALYRIADAMRAFGWRGPHDRLWQVGFPSPHLSYFHPDALARLARGEGFDEIDRLPLPSVSREGLWARLRYDRRASWPARAITWSCVSLALPLLRHARADIVLQVFRHDAHQRVADHADAGAGSAGVTTATR